MKIALRSMRTSTFFFSNKKVNTKDINKCFDGKINLIVWNTKTIIFFFLHNLISFGIIFYRLKAKGGQLFKKSHLLGHIPLLHIDS